MVVSMSVIVCLEVLGCSEPNKIPPQDRLVTVADSLDLKRTNSDGVSEIRFRLSKPYPASDAISELREKIETTGWKPLSAFYYNREISTSLVRGWCLYADTTTSPPTPVHNWSLQWENSKGDILDYTFTYESSKQNPEDLSEGQVRGYFIPKTIRVSNERKYKKMGRTIQHSN